MRFISRKTSFAGASAAALAVTLMAPAIASADASLITFDAVDNGDCTATFNIENNVNIGGDWAKVNYWVGVDAPESAPVFGDNRGNDGAVKAKAALTKSDGSGEVATYGFGNKYVRSGLKTETTTETVDFSKFADQPQNQRTKEGEVNISFRFSGVDTKDYDNKMKKLIITGCGDDDGEVPGADPADGGIFGSIGSIDVFGSLAGPTASLEEIIGA